MKSMMAKKQMKLAHGEAKAHGKGTYSKRTAEVVVVACPSAFPISSRTKSLPKRDLEERDRKPGSRTDNNNSIKAGAKSKFDQKKLLDWSQTARDIHKLGASGFVGKQKRAHQDDQYESLTGRQKKRHQVPLPLVRRIRAKAEEREARKAQESKDAGIILPNKKQQNKRKKDSNFRVHGPSPSIGFMKNGIFRVNSKSP